MNLKVQFDGVVTRRWKETSKTGRENFYIAVKVQRGNYADVFRIRAKDMESVKPFAIDAEVSVEAFVGGREWINPTTDKPTYFTDLNLASIKAKEDEKPAEAAAAAASEADDPDDLPF